MVPLCFKQHMASEFQDRKTSEVSCWERMFIFTIEYLPPPKEKCLMFSMLYHYICFAHNYLILHYKKDKGGTKGRVLSPPHNPHNDLPPPLIPALPVGVG